MKLLIVVCTIFVLSFITSSQADCSDNSWVSVKNLDVGKILGRWYAVLRFANGKYDNSDCLWHDLIIHPTIPNAIKDTAHRSFKSGKSHRTKSINGAITLADSRKTKGTLHVSYSKGAVADKFITTIDYDEFAILRACYDNEEHFWAYSRNQYPSNSTLTNIYNEIDAQGIDTSKLIESCTDVRASDIV